MVALDRPGYGSSAPYPEAVARPEQRVQLAYGAVDRILGERPRGAGVFLMGHSGGCELTMRMAADERGGDLLGIELAGTGRHYHPAAREMLRRQPGNTARRVCVNCYGTHRNCIRPRCSAGPRFIPAPRPTRTRWCPTGPARTFRRSHPPCASRCSSASPSTRRFGRPTLRRWPRSRRCSPARRGSLIHHQPEAGHNISLGHTAADYHATVLAFADECVVAR